MSGIDWAFVLPLLVLNGVATLLSLKGRYHARRSRRRQVLLIWLLPVIGAAIALWATTRHEPPAARLSVSRARTTHRYDGATVWSSAAVYRYQHDGPDRGGGSDGGAGFTGSADAGGGDGGCGGGGDAGGCH